MIFPKLPTDNLYKFLALAGMVVFILSNYFSLTRIVQVGDRIIDVEEAQLIFKARQESLKSKSERLHKIIDNSLAEKSVHRKEDLEKLEIHYSETEIKELVNQVYEIIDKQGIESAKLQMSLLKVVDLKKLSDKIRNINIIFSAIGGLMIYNGFSLWYRRVQKPLDELLQMELLIHKQPKSALNDNADGKT